MIVLINPNSTVTMTEAMLRTARQSAPELEIVGWTSHDGPAAIQGRADGAAAEGPMLELVKKATKEGASCIIIGCFDDTGLGPAREISLCPVIGIGQAAYHLACLAGARFSVVTTLAVSVPILEENIARYGLTSSLGRVVGSGVPVLDLERAPEAATETIAHTIRAVQAEIQVDTIVLGCGGMVDIEARLSQDLNLRFIDGVRAAAHVARALI